MALVPNTPKISAGALQMSSIALGTSGDTLVYNANSGQELHLFNTSGASVNVTVDGPNGTTVLVPGAGDQTVSVAAGYTMAVPAGKFVLLSLDKVSAFLQGTPVAITAATGAVVQASITQ